MTTSRDDKLKYYLGVDWGLKTTGLAIADSELKIATVLPEVKTEGLIARIKELQKEYKNLTVVFGVLEQAEKFANRNNHSLQVKKNEILQAIKDVVEEVVVSEEMLTTKIAQQNLLASGKKNVSKKDNSESAKIILQSWLDK
jgi:RNase H-fold protein (predicted Holliday junction resolvase)